MTSEIISVLGPLLTNRFGDRYFYEVNRQAFDQVGFEGVFDKYFGKYFYRPNRLYIIIGTDSGLLLSRLVKEKLPEGSRYIFIELPTVLEALRQEGLLEKLPDRVAVIEIKTLQDQAKAFQFENYVYLESAELRESLAAVDSHLCAYRELSEVALSWMKREAFGISANIGISSFIKRQLENLAENRHPAALLRGIFQGKTAVLLAGGPSLDEILPWVKANRDRLIILAVSRISRQLLKEELFPHFIVSVDPQDISFEVSREMLHLHEKSIFVHAYHVSPLLLSQWQGRSLYLGTLFPWTSPLNENNIAVSGPTVTNSALTLAVEMGCSQVVLAGVDLCFSKQGFTHSRGSNESLAGPLLGATAFQVETNGGEKASTNAGYRSAIDILNTQAAYARAYGCQVLNPAPGATRIENIEYRPLGNIELPSQDGSPVSKALKLMPCEESRDRQEHYRAVIAELNRAEKGLAKIRSLAQEALVCNDGLFGRKGRKANFKYKLRMDKIEKRINTELADFAPCVKQYGIRGFLKITRTDKDQQWTDTEIESIGRIYYEAYRDSAQELSELIQSAVDRLKARLEEEAPEPDFALLFAQWKQDGQPGRHRIWRERLVSSGGFLPAEMLSQGMLLDEMFSRLITDEETKHRRIVTKGRGLTRVPSNAAALFQRKDLAGLRLLLGNLQGHPDAENAQVLSALVQGYMAELDEKPEEALEAYQNLIGETFTPVAEDALRRIATICLGQGNSEMALLALDCLANAALSYKPQYAELLRLTGRLQDAADTFTDYLEAVPTDIATLLKLGQLYRTMGHEDVARQVFHMALDQDPHNSAAKLLLAGV